jgi:hypothetical protein
MSANRGDSRRLEKQKRRRAEIKKKQSAAQAALRPSALFKRATDFPIEQAWLSTSWRDVDRDMPGLVTAIVTRRSPGGMLVGTALVDRTCLGIKDGYAQVLPATEAERYIDEVHDHVELERVDSDTCLSVVHHAIAYARKLGFTPHEDFPEMMFGPRPQKLLDTPLCNPTRPLYVAGPNDDTVAIFATLRASAGSDFRYLIPTPDGEGHPVEARDTMRILESMREIRSGEGLLREGRFDEAEAICDGLLKDGHVKFDAAELKARVCEARGDLSGAIDWLRQALDARPSDIEPEEEADVRNELRRLMTETSRSDSSIDLLGEDDGS